MKRKSKTKTSIEQELYLLFTLFFYLQEEIKNILKLFQHTLSQSSPTSNNNIV